MKLALKIILSTFFVVVCSTTLSAKSWHGITPLKSTRDDVARVTNQTIDASAITFKYDNEIEHVEFFFSDPKNPYDQCGSIFPTGTVRSISVYPKFTVSLTDLQGNETRFRQLESSAEFLIDGDAYFAEQEGLVVTTKKGFVHKVAYIGAESDRNRCPAFYNEPRLFADRILCIMCPSVTVSCSDDVGDGEPATFTVTVTAGTPEPRLTYTWTVTGGKIVEGQGTSYIKVDSKGLQGKTITATVEVSGIDPACSGTASCSTPITRKP